MTQGICSCSRCCSSKIRKYRTIKEHLKHDQEILRLNRSTLSASVIESYERHISMTLNNLETLRSSSNPIAPGQSDHTWPDEGDLDADQGMDFLEQQPMQDPQPTQYSADKSRSLLETPNELSSECDSDGTGVSDDTDIDSDGFGSPDQLFLDSLPPDDPALMEDVPEEEEDYQEIDPTSLDESPLFSIPNSVQELYADLLGDYSLPTSPPTEPPPVFQLTESQRLSLTHFITWQRTNGTVSAYETHARNLEKASGIEIISLYRVRQLAASITDLKPVKVDVCPHSCIAYTGEFANLDSCPFIRDKAVCGLARYHKLPSNQKNTQTRTVQKPQPRAQMITLPIMATIKAMYSNTTSSNLMRHRDRTLQQVLSLLANASHGGRAPTYSDFCDGQVLIFFRNQEYLTNFCDGQVLVFLRNQENSKLFHDLHDVALALSTDGAQLTMKKLSDTWILIITILNLPPELRYQSNNVIHVFATPGPRAPGNIESFCYPLFQEMAKASEGIWTWDAIDSSYFVLRAWIVMVLGDMLGSAKLSGMAGHTAVHGDRFSLVKGARSSTKKGSKSQYYPITPPGGPDLNPGRPIYNLKSIPIRSEGDYWETIQRLKNAPTKAERARIVTQTGVSRMPLAIASQAFLHPSYFPLDPFHLFYENCMSFIWDLWTSHSKPFEIFHMNREFTQQFGAAVASAMETLPPSFCGPIRDPFLKRNSQYKVYEWMGLLHWYIIPIGLELGLNEQVLANFADFADIIEFAMTIHPRTLREIQELHNQITKFLTEFELIYVGNNPENITRCRLCIFQLIHVPQHILWNGSVRVGSQATVERAIGEVGRKIRSKREPFANLANLVYERELIKIILQYHPDLAPAPLTRKNPSTLQGSSREVIRKREESQAADTPHSIYLNALSLFLGKEIVPQTLRRWKKLWIPGQTARLHSVLGESVARRTTSRSTRFFEAKIHDVGIINETPIFGEALCFYEVTGTESSSLYVVYRPVIDLSLVLRRWRGKWSSEVSILAATALKAIIGIWEYGDHVHILRKHPALSSLTEFELGLGPPSELDFELE